MVDRGRINLLLLDVIMPKKNGKEVYEKIRIFEPAVKAIFLSGYPEEVMHKKGLLEKRLQLSAQAGRHGGPPATGAGGAG